MINVEHFFLFLPIYIFQFLSGGEKIWNKVTTWLNSTKQLYIHIYYLKI